MTVHSEVRCDHDGCRDAVDGGYLGSTPEEAIERAEREYDWYISKDNPGRHLCDEHRGEP